MMPAEWLRNVFWAFVLSNDDDDYLITDVGINLKFNEKKLQKSARRDANTARWL